VELPGRGAPFVRRLAGPPGAPTLVLLHGLTGTADLTWTPSYRDLVRFFSVVAPDLRGHGDGIPSGPAYRLEDCADDVAALARALEVKRAIVVGYSMGGVVAQLVWRRHPELVAGLVLCSTACDFRLSPAERLSLVAALATASCLRAVPPLFRLGYDTCARVLVGHLDDPVQAWARSEFGRCGLATTLAAAVAVSGFSSRPWIEEVDVPAAVVVTREDRVVPPHRQLELARLLPRAGVYNVRAGHGACLNATERFLPALVAACREVAGPAPAGVDR
jgi:pimeloyl-ACP methyl ester carboxylesterase